MRIDLVREIAEEAGSLLGRLFLSGDFSSQVKGRNEPVTTADLTSERYILGSLKKAFPTHTIVSEEAGITQGNPSLVWYVDPLDGTRNFVRGIPTFSVGIGLAESGMPILGVVCCPMTSEVFHAEKDGGCFLNGMPVHVSACSDAAACLIGMPDDIGNDHLWHDLLAGWGSTGPAWGAVRVQGSSLVDLAHVASGRLDARLKWMCRAWDQVPGQILVEEAGGRVSDWQGKPCKSGAERFLASNGNIHGSLLRHLSVIDPILRQ